MSTATAPLNSLSDHADDETLGSCVGQGHTPVSDGQHRYDGQTTSAVADGSNVFLSDHTSSGTHQPPVGQELSPGGSGQLSDGHRTTCAAATGSTTVLPDPPPFATHSKSVGQATNSLIDPLCADTHGRSVGQGSTPGSGPQRSEAQKSAAITGHHTPDPTTLLSVPVAGSSGQDPLPVAAANFLSLPNGCPPLLLDPTLMLAADVLDDIERTANANANRLRQLTRVEADSDGRYRGAGLTLDHPQVATLAAMVGTLKSLEKDATRNLEKAMKAHPLGPWVAGQAGVGLKQAARLLAAIGDPYWRDDILNEDGSVRVPAGPRTVSALWAYCGRHVADGAAVKRRRGVKSNWSSQAGSRAYVIAESCIKQTGAVMSNGAVRPRSPYRDVYDGRRARTLETRPEWTDGHRHNDALRVTSKAVLRDLWVEARRLHWEAAGLTPG